MAGATRSQIESLYIYISQFLFHFIFIYLHCIFLFYLMVMITVTYLICCFYYYSGCLFLLFYFVTHSLTMTVTWLSTLTELVTRQNTFCMISCSGNIHTSSHTHTTTAKRRHMCIRHIQAQQHTYTHVKYHTRQKPRSGGKKGGKRTRDLGRTGSSAGGLVKEERPLSTRKEAQRWDTARRDA